jgi:altronate dehydratase small subunit
MPKRAIRINPKDNVATLVETAASGDEVAVVTGPDTQIVTAKEQIPANFKIALVNIARGEAILKYGEVIGEASMDIPRGTKVHLHNLIGRRGRGDLARKDLP